MPPETLLLKFWQSSGVWRFLDVGADDLGDVKDVAAVDAVLAGDQVILCADGVNEEATLGEALPSSAVRPRTLSAFVLMNGTVGFCRWLARCTMVWVPSVPLNFALSWSICSENLCDKLLLRDSLDPGVGVTSDCSSGCPSR